MQSYNYGFVEPFIMISIDAFAIKKRLREWNRFEV